MLLMILLQAAAQNPPDIQFEARAQIRDLRVERKGEARLEVRGGPDSKTEVEAPDFDGRSRLRKVDVEVRAEARIADPAENPAPSETPQPN